MVYKEEENPIHVWRVLKIYYLMQACKGLEKLCRSPDPRQLHISDQSIAWKRHLILIADNCRRTRD